MEHQRPDHSAEIAALEAHARLEYLSALEAKAVLTAIEMLRAHEQGLVEICRLPHAASLVSLCLGRPFDPTPRC